MSPHKILRNIAHKYEKYEKLKIEIEFFWLKNMKIDLHTSIILYIRGPFYKEVKQNLVLIIS